jgi:hypothetical protein
MVIADSPIRRSIIHPVDYAGHKQKDLIVFIPKVETMLESDMAIYLTDRDQMLFEKQYFVGDTTTAWNQYHSRYSEDNHT